MTQQLILARQLLDAQDYTCVIVSGEQIHTSKQRGVAPLLHLLDSGIDLKGACAADKVVGKATAMLYILLGVAAVHARVISLAAAEILNRSGIAVSFDLQADYIRNRTQTGRCPMEQAVEGVEDPQQALYAIRRKLEQLRQN